MGEKTKRKLSVEMRMVMRTGLRTQFSDLTALQMACFKVIQTCVAGLRFFAIQRQCLDQLIFLTSYQTREEAGPTGRRVDNVVLSGCD